MNLKKDFNELKKKCSLIIKVGGARGCSEEYKSMVLPSLSVWIQILDATFSGKCKSDGGAL
jgi:hypothetical protein